MAKPPRSTTVAHIKPRVPKPVAAFSSTARRRAKRVSFFSGALTAVEDLSELSSLSGSQLSLFSILLRPRRGSNIVAHLLVVSLSLLSSPTCRRMLPSPSPSPSKQTL
ncbi:ARM repeat superfamily protein [Trifolium repens]|nr:ARM repeat superfamily protein [Trifolium repens]